MRTVFRARVKQDGPRRAPWVRGGVMDKLLGRDLEVFLASTYADGTRTYQTVCGNHYGWFIHEDDLELFESWVEWPGGAQLVSSTYTAERLLPGID